MDPLEPRAPQQHRLDLGTGHPPGQREGRKAAKDGADQGQCHAADCAEREAACGREQCSGEHRRGEKYPGAERNCGGHDPGVENHRP
jgi:hypothetical protein